MHDDKIGVEHLGQISGEQQTTSRFVRSVDTNDDGVGWHQLMGGIDFVLGSDVCSHDSILSRSPHDGRAVRPLAPGSNTRGRSTLPAKGRPC